MLDRAVGRATDLRRGDCTELITGLPADSVDMVFTDPPYGTTDLKLDDGAPAFDWPAFHAELKRVLTPAGWFFCWFPGRAAHFLLPHWQHRFEYIGLKSAGTMGHHNTMRPIYKHEILWAFCQPGLKRMGALYFDREALRTTGKPYKRTGRCKPTEFRKDMRIHFDRHTTDNRGTREPNTLLDMEPKNHQPRRERTAHPTQKPLDLTRLVVRGYCPPDGTVLDPFAGSGTTLLAAATTGRRGLGFELDPRYFKLAAARLDGRLDSGAFDEAGLGL